MWLEMSIDPSGGLVRRTGMALLRQTHPPLPPLQLCCGANKRWREWERSCWAQRANPAQRASRGCLEPEQHGSVIWGKEKAPTLQ